MIEKRTRRIIDSLLGIRKKAEVLVARSLLSQPAKNAFLAILADRFRAVGIS